MFERTPEFEAFVQPARANNELWRVAVAVVAGLVVYIFGAMVLMAGYFIIDPSIEGEFYNAMNGGGEPASTTVTGLILATFIPMLFGASTMCAIHMRSPLTLLGHTRNFWSLFALGLLLIVAGHSISGVFQALFAPIELISNLNIGPWLGILAWALPLLFVQIVAEELIFRGYLQQQLAARFNSAWIWMILPSVVFALGHYQGTLEPGLAWMIVLATGLFGVVAADLTRMTGSLACAIGLHLANNFTALMVVSLPGELSGLALYHTPFSIADAEIVKSYLVFDIAVILGIWITARRILR